MSFSVALVAFAACSSSDDSIAEEPTPAQPANGKYTMTIQASKGDNAMTRALKTGTDGLDGYWSGTETIYVSSYDLWTREEKYIGTATATASPTAGTTITATLTEAPAEGNWLNFYLNGNMSSSDALMWTYTGQVGLLTGTNSISEKYDYYWGTLDDTQYTVSGTTITPNTTLAFEYTPNAIVKFTLVDKDNSDAPISATSLNIHSDESNPLVLERDPNKTNIELSNDLTITPGSPGASEIYVALHNIDADYLTLTANDGNNVYTYSKSDVTFDCGRYYEITVKMKKILSRVNSSNAEAVFSGGCKAITTEQAVALAKQCWTVAGNTVYVVKDIDGFTVDYIYTSDGKNTSDVIRTTTEDFVDRYVSGTNTAWFVEPPKAAADATTEDVGKVIGADGNIYANKSAATAAGTTAVAKIIYVGATGNATYCHGLALAMSDASWGIWSTSNGSAHTYKTSNSGDFSSIIEDGLQYNSSHNNESYPAFMNAIANNGITAPTNCSSWFLPTGYQWQLMINAAGGFADLRNGFASVGGTNMASDDYWSSTEWNGNNLYAWAFSSYWNEFRGFGKDSGLKVRSALAF